MLASDPEAQAPRIAAEARNSRPAVHSRLAVQEKHAAGWLLDRGLVVKLADDREVVPAEPLQNAIDGEKPAPAAAAPEKKRGGRPPVWDWPPVMAKLQKRREEEGEPLPGEQAAMEAFAMGLFPPDKSPAPSTIRQKVTLVIQAFVDVKSNEGRKPS